MSEKNQRVWKPLKAYEDILFDYYNGIARITINRERYRNAFTPVSYTHLGVSLTTTEWQRSFASHTLVTFAQLTDLSLIHISRQMTIHSLYN